MSVQLQDYPDMVDRLGKGGFDADQSAALIQLVGRLFSAQNEHIDAVLDKVEQIRHDNHSEHEKTRSEARAEFEKIRTEGRENLKELETKFENKFEILDGKIERNWRWTIAMLTAISVSLISALTLLLLRSIE